MSKVIPVIFFLGGCLLLWILYLNRSSSRIHETTAVIAIVIIGAIFFVTKEEPIQKKIHVAYFISNKDKIPLFFPNARILGQRYRNENVIFTNHLKRLSDGNMKVSFDFPSDFGPLIDLHAIAVLEYLFMNYHRYWYVEKDSVELPFGDFAEIRPVEIADVRKDLTICSRDSLPTLLRQNRFFDDSFGFSDIALPKGTKMLFTSHEGDHQFREYRFYKRFSFDIKIKMRFSSYTIGLGNVGDYVGLTDPQKEVYDTADENVNNYGQVILITECQAKFNRLMTYNPKVVRYRKWAENLFDGLHDSFDWSVCRNKMRDYQQDLSNQLIINKSK